MVALKGTEIVDVSIAEAVGKEKRVDPRGQLAETARRAGISFGEPEPDGAAES